MKQYLRPLNALEKRLYDERIGALNKLLQDSRDEMDANKFQQVIDASDNTVKFLEAAGFVPTEKGVMARAELDILDCEHSEEFMSRVEADLERVRKVMCGNRSGDKA